MSKDDWPPSASEGGGYLAAMEEHRPRSVTQAQRDADRQAEIERSQAVPPERRCGMVMSKYFADRACYLEKGHEGAHRGLFLGGTQWRRP